MKKTYSKSLLFYIAMFFIWLIPMLFLFPVADDWVYVTSPHMNITIEDLLPSATFWRPFDVIWGGLLSFAPWMFPFLNKVVVVLGHILCAFIIEKIISRMKFNTFAKFFTLMFFLFSTAAIAVTSQTDSLNQVYSLLFGLCGLYCFIEKPNSKLYLFFGVLSLLWKENGVVWFFIPPMFQTIFEEKGTVDIFKSKSIVKAVIMKWAVGVLVVGIYFAIRFLLTGGISLGSADGSSRYSVSFFRISTLLNIVNPILLTYGGIDSLAVFLKPTNYLCLAITGFCTLLFLIFVLFQLAGIVRRQDNLFVILIIIVTGIAITLPTSILGIAGEMHAYPVSFSSAIFYGYIINKSKMNKTMILAIVCIFMSLLVSNVHKYVSLYDYGYKTEKITQQMYDAYGDKDDTLLIIAVDERMGYSIYHQEAMHGTSNAFGTLRKHFNYTQKLNITSFFADTQEKADTKFLSEYDNYDMIWLIQDYNLSVLKSGR